MGSECPFFVWNNNSSFFGDYWCKVQDKKVYSDLYNEYCKYSTHTQCPYFKPERKSGGCFLTTACVEYKGLPDDCHELTAMRRLRDEWLAKQPGGQTEIDDYYAIAPGIVAKIKAREDADALLERLYQEYILPCTSAVDAGEFERAYQQYRKMIAYVKEVEAK